MPQDSANSSVPLKVLVVDDDTQIQELLVDGLSLDGHEVRTAGNGRKAVAVWREWQPQVVLMDRQMPLMDGLEAAREIRSQEVTHAVPRATIVSISSSVSPAEHENLRALGFDAFLPKPFLLRDLHDLLARI